MKFVTALLTVGFLLICAVNSHWSTWTVEHAGPCSSSCLRRVTLSRQCEQTKTSEGNSSCTGNSTVAIAEQCKGDNCSVVHGEWSTWSETGTGPCSVTCGPEVGYQFVTYSRKCNSSAATDGGQRCLGNVSMNTTKTCRANVTCHPRGVWSTWSETGTGPCSVTCGPEVGYQVVNYSRKCNSPAPTDGGPRCLGNVSMNETKTCRANVSCNLEGAWGEWTTKTVGSCSISCGNKPGTFTVTKIRACTSPAAKDGDRKCAGNATRIVVNSCLVPECPVYGVWSTWVVTFGTCSSNCFTSENGARNCTNPAPERGEVTCVGEPVYLVERKCSEGRCHGNVTGLFGGISSFADLMQLRGTAWLIIAAAASILTLVLSALCIVFIIFLQERRRKQRMEKLRERKRTIRFGTPETIPLRADEGGSRQTVTTL